MASEPSDTASSAQTKLETPRAPLAGTRSQAMQRLQVGLFGLGSMVLLVALANIIMNNLRQNEAQVVAEAAPNEPGPETVRPSVRDPLADAGVVPDMPPRPAEEVTGSNVNDPPPQP